MDTLKNLIEELTLSGCPVLDESKFRNIKKLCKKSDTNIEETFKLTMLQLEKDHAEIRLSAFLIIDQIFRRSHHFRTLMIKDMNKYIPLVFEVDSQSPLPPPKEAMETLKVKAIVAMEEWHETFGQAYKRIQLAHHYLKTCHKIDFQNVNARNRSQQLLKKQKEEEQKKRQAENLLKTRSYIVEKKPWLEESLIELQNGLEILIPSVTNICSNLEFDADDFKSDDSGSNTIRQHGLHSAYNLEIDLGSINSTVQSTESNSILVEKLDELVKNVEGKMFQRIKKWTYSLTKNGGNQSEVVDLVNIREQLAKLVQKYKALDIRRKTEVESTAREDSDDDFEPVMDAIEKEGYEPVIPPHKRKEYGLDPAKTPKVKLTNQARLVTKPKRKNVDNSVDPTSHASTMKKLKESGIIDKLKAQLPARAETSVASTSAPVVNYDRDLYYLFENPDAPLPQFERKESFHRFWTPRDESMPDTVTPANVESSLKMRKMHFTGKFVPVQHKCNATLPSGKLCPRMDRINCPFHGRIIPRDSKGLPLDEELRKKELLKKEERAAQSSALIEAEESKSVDISEEVPPWLDKDLIKDIEAQTGKDLGSKYLEKKEKREKGKKDKGKGKKSKKPESNLTSLSSAKDTVRGRLEKKLFNPATVKRVNSVLNKMDKQKTHDKFGDNFNYVHGLDKG